MLCAPNPKKGNFLDNRSFTLLLKKNIGFLQTQSVAYVEVLLIFLGIVLCTVKKGDHVRDMMFVMF